MAINDLNKKRNEFINAATRENTRRTYRSAIVHFEKWGGFLPSSTKQISEYLTEYADTLSVVTLQARKAALSCWHVEQGFPDPTDSPYIKKLLKGIRTLKQTPQKQARPLEIEFLEKTVIEMESQKNIAISNNNFVEIRKICRNKAMLLIGFWKAFRPDELSRITVENISIDLHKGMKIFLPRAKGDRNAKGTWKSVPAIKKLCPVEACFEWLDISKIAEGPLFRKIDRWGRVSSEGLHVNSFTPIVKKILNGNINNDFNKINETQQYTAYSLRRGFATWASEKNDWSLKHLMEYVGWKDSRSALRYIDLGNNFQSTRLLIENSLKQENKQV